LHHDRRFRRGYHHWRRFDRDWSRCGFNDCGRCFNGWGRRNFNRRNHRRLRRSRDNYDRRRRWRFGAGQRLRNRRRRFRRRWGAGRLNRGRRRGLRSRGSRGCDAFRKNLPEFILEILGGDLVERAAGNLGGGNAHLLGFPENFFVLQAKFLCDIVNANGHSN